VWDVAVARTAQGWTAEFRIPFSQLRFNPTTIGTFGFAVSRTASGYVSSFGQLTGLAFSSDKRLELVPYALAEARTGPVAPGNPLVSSPDPSASLGLDLKYKLAPGLTLTGTVNPDFGQVEADPAVVNLGAFETFFAEQRPFFVEGSGNFSFNVDCEDGRCTGLFYSRRIGRAPHGSVPPPLDGYATQPAATTILGAAKLAGRVGKFTVGMGLLPEVRTTLSGKVANIEKGRVEQLMQEHADHALTITLLKGLLLAKKVADHVEGKLDGVTLHVTLGVPPGVNVELH
jgi:hypothetical protein